MTDETAPPSSNLQLIERLRKWEEPLKNPLASHRESIEAAKLCCDARCEIERLRRSNSELLQNDGAMQRRLTEVLGEQERLRAALKWIEDHAFDVERIGLAEKATNTLRAADETTAEHPLDEWLVPTEKGK